MARAIHSAQTLGLGTLRQQDGSPRAQPSAALDSARRAPPSACAPGSLRSAEAPSSARAAGRAPSELSLRSLPARAARPPSSIRGGTLLEVRAVGPAVRIFRLARPRGFTFEAGQSLKVGLERAPVRRRYSIASAPHDPEIELCVEAVPGGQLTSHLFELSPGDQVSLAPAAKGKLSLRADRRRHVLIATVTGIAPLRSLLRAALAEAPAGAAPQEFWVLHGASFADELPFAEELAELARRDARVHYLPTVSRPGAPRNRGWTGHTGRVETLVLPTLRALGSKDDVAVYACGHPEMVRAVRELLTPLGYPVLGESFD